MPRIGASVLLALPLAIAGCSAGPPTSATTGATAAGTLPPTAAASASPTASAAPESSPTPALSPTEEVDGAVSGDLGIGETLLLVVGAAHATQAEAEAAALSFGDMQGFYVDVTDNYRLLDVCADLPVGPGLDDGQLVAGQWLQLSAFRTSDGALDFMELVETAEGYGFGDAYAGAAIYLVEKTGGPYVGLGQESDPRGGGPLAGPLPEPPACP